MAIDLQNSLVNIGSAFPKARRDAGNARIDLESNSPNQISSPYKDLVMGDREIKMSAKGLIEILAGKLTIQDFLRFYHSGKDLPVYNPFEPMLKQGRLIDEIVIEKSKEEDDDLVTIRFGDSDPAISPFKVPTPYPKSSSE